MPARSSDSFACDSVHPDESEVTYDIAMQYLPKDTAQVGTSLGSFSVGALVLEVGPFPEQTADF